MISNPKQKTKIPKCIYCHTLANIDFESYIYPNVDADNKESVKDFIDSVYCLPSKKTTKSDTFIKHDSRCTNNNNLQVKDTKMIRCGIAANNKQCKRIRYITNNKHNKAYIQNGMYTCKCGKTLWSDGNTTGLVSYSEKFGYDLNLSQNRQSIISKNKRK